MFGVVRVLTRDADGFRLSELLLAVLGNEVVLDVDKFALLVDPLECVATIAVVVGPSLRCTVVTEEHHTGVNRFGGVAEQIECGIVVEQEVTRVACLGTDNIGSLDRVAAEEDREVEANNVVVAPRMKKSANCTLRTRLRLDHLLLGVELDSKTTRVASLVRELTTQGNGRETNEDGCLLANG